MSMIVLSQKGFNDLLLKKENGIYSILDYVDNYGTKRWKKLPQSQKQIDENIAKYGTKKKKFTISQGASNQIGKTIKVM